MSPMSGNDFHGRRVLVMGLGRFGGGIAVTRWLAGQGAEVTVTDKDDAEKLAESVQQLHDVPVRYRLGGHDEADLDGCDLLVVSPAVDRRKADFVHAAIARGIPLSSELNLFVERCPARRVVGVTGSAGKSTTTAMLGSVLEAAAGAGCWPAAWMGGNIGRSLLGELDRIGPDDIVVLELSSFQLEDMGTLRWSPPLAVITNIRPNHLDRHGTMEDYTQAKLNIARFQDTDGLVFVHQEEEAVARAVVNAGAASRLRQYVFDDRFSEALRVPGRHNELNAAAAIAVARAMDVPDDVIAAGLSRFTGLPHRLELVGEHAGVRYYNDSKSTTPESSLIALEAFSEPVVMLLGGRDKGMAFDELAEGLVARARAAVCYGETGPKIYAEVLKAAGGISRPDFRSVLLKGFDEAVHRARDLAEPGDVVVLSPAYTSYDMFPHYEARGDRFRALVQSFGRPKDSTPASNR
jgi:UDP-N-acetylmuramoylalanine--D-glutamate ligase